MKLKHIAIIGSLFPILFSLVLFFGVLIELSVSKELGGKLRLSELCITSSAVPPLST